MNAAESERILRSWYVGTWHYGYQWMWLKRPHEIPGHNHNAIYFDAERIEWLFLVQLEQRVLRFIVIKFRLLEFE